MTLGLTNGNNNFGMVSGVYNASGSYALGQSFSAYGKGYGGSGAEKSTADTWCGVTPDPTKSGLITKFSGLTLGTVNSKKLGSFYIRY